MKCITICEMRWREKFQRLRRLHEKQDRSFLTIHIPCHSVFIEYLAARKEKREKKKEINEAAERHSFIAFINVLVNFIINHALCF